jgi:hypothetical protein
MSYFNIGVFAQTIIMEEITEKCFFSIAIDVQ